MYEFVSANRLVHSSHFVILRIYIGQLTISTKSQSYTKDLYMFQPNTLVWSTGLLISQSTVSLDLKQSDTLPDSSVRFRVSSQPQAQTSESHILWQYLLLQSNIC